RRQVAAARNDGPQRLLAETLRRPLRDEIRWYQRREWIGAHGRGAMQKHVGLCAQFAHQPFVGRRPDAHGRPVHRGASVRRRDHVDGQVWPIRITRLPQQRTRMDHLVSPVELVAPRPVARAKYETRSTTIGLSAVTRKATLVSCTCGLTSIVIRDVAPTLKRCGGGGSPSWGR